MARIDLDVKALRPEGIEYESVAASGVCIPGGLAQVERANQSAADRSCDHHVSHVSSFEEWK